MGFWNELVVARVPKQGEYWALGCAKFALYMESILDYMERDHQPSDTSRSHDDIASSFDLGAMYNSFLS